MILTCAEMATEQKILAVRLVGEACHPSAATCPGREPDGGTRIRFPVMLSQMLDAELPGWLENVDVHTIAVLTLDDGECLTADILEFDDEHDELVVDVVSSNRSYPKRDQRRRGIPVRRVVSCESRSRTEQPWPYSDPCRGASFSLARFVLLATLFLCLIVGSVPLFLLLPEKLFGVQEASAIVYTIFVVFLTFAATRGFRPYMFTCPAVQTQISRLFWRHVGFLVALFAIQTLALEIRPKLPDWWNSGRKGTPFDIVLILLCYGLAYAQVWSNRSLIGRAHREFSS